MGRLRVVAGTGNAAKAAELRRVLAGAVAVEEAPRDISPKIREHDPERAGDVAHVAAAKAREWSRALTERGEGNAFVVASDGGLLIPALGAAWDPLRTRRFAGEDADDRARAEALLALASGLEGEERKIGWREAAAVARSGQVLKNFVAESPPGLLAHEVDPAGLTAGDGFWVPAIWLCPEFGGKRLSELTAAEREARQDHWTLLGRELRRFFGGMSRSWASDR
jgi:inosine/xanthosine triphosphate pyrophosphatase family protein